MGSKNYVKYIVRVRNIHTSDVTIGTLTLAADATATIWDTKNFTSAKVVDQNNMRDNMATVCQLVAESKIQLESDISGSFVTLAAAQAFSELDYENATMQAVEKLKDAYTILAAIM